MARIGIVGLGLMGGSLGLAARDPRAAHHVIGYDPDRAARASALAQGCVDLAEDSLAAIAGCEIAIVCAPVTQLPAVIGEVLAAAPEATVSDIGSTKVGVIAGIAASERHRFIGGHPMCGLELRGADHASGELFAGATWFLTPTIEVDPDRHRDLHRFIASTGAVPRAIDAPAHDRLLALISHLPHALANMLVNQAGDARIAGHDPLAAIGGSFRDMTRVAGANPRIWVDIFLENRVELAAALREHQRATAEVVTALEAGDAGFLARWIGQASSNRKRSLAAQFATPPEDLYRVSVHIASHPGVFAGITQGLGAARINIEDFEMHHESAERGGLLELIVAGEDVAARCCALLDEQGYSAIAVRVVEEP